MGFADQEEDELQRFLEKDDLVDFEKEQSVVRSLWQNQPFLEERSSDSRLESQPPVKLYVGKIPLGLLENGLRNYFNKYVVLNADLIKGAGGEFNFGFVTLASPKKAEEAIRALNGAPPLHLTVNYARSKKSNFDDLEKQIQDLQLKFNESNKPEVVEENWDQEIKAEEEMFESLDKFREDYSSDDDIDLTCKNKVNPAIPPENDEPVMPPASDDVKALKLKPPCKRCGKESMFKCGKCSKERYCSQSCQSLDWFSHKHHCQKDLSSNRVQSLPDDPVASNDESVQNCHPNVIIDPDEVVHSNLKGILSGCKNGSPVHETYFEKDLVANQLVDGCIELLDVSGNWALVRHLSIEADAAIMEKLLEDNVLKNLVDPPCQGQLALAKHKRKVIRVVVDQINEDCSVGIRGLDVQFTQKLTNFQLLFAFPQSLTHFSSELKTCKLESNHTIKKTDAGVIFTLKILGMKKKFPLVELSRYDAIEHKKRHSEEESKTNLSPPVTPVADRQNFSEIKGWDDSFISSGTPRNLNTRGEPKNVTADKEETPRIPIMSPVINQTTFSNVSSNSSSSSWMETSKTELSLKIQEVYVVHNEGPTELYVTPNLKTLRDFQRYLYKTGSSLDYDPMFLPGLGDVVLARSRSDKYWYRALITDMEKLVTFWCPDFGFTESVEMKDIRAVNRRLAPYFKKNPFLACKCELMDWKSGTKKATKEEIKYIKKKLPVSEDPIKVNVIAKGDSKYVIDVRYLCRS